MYDKMLAGNVEGKLFAETSTILPETTEKLARRVEQAGGQYVAMPSTLPDLEITLCLLVWMHSTGCMEHNHSFC